MLTTKRLLATKLEDSRNLHVDSVPDRIKLLTNIQAVLKWSNATPIRCVGRIGYVCCYCNDQYVAPSNLKKHTLDKHPNKDSGSYTNMSDLGRYYVKVDITNLHCTICYEGIDTLDELMQHLNSDHKKRLFMEVKNYMVPFKFDSDTLRCFICLNKFNRFKGLLEHMNTHCRNFVCNICDSGFITRTSLMNHEKTHENGSFSCRICAKVFSSLRKTKNHEKSVHLGAMPYKCSLCSEGFRDYQRKLRHLIKVHGVTPNTLNCHACDRTFTTQKSYREHTKRYHLMLKNYECSECEMKFFSSTELKEHMVKHTGAKNFQCDICLKTFGRKSTLRDHLRIHMDDRRHKCEHCGMAFVQKCSWRGHMKTRHGETV